jgi:hypothetical protein
MQISAMRPGRFLNLCRDTHLVAGKNDLGISSSFGCQWEHQAELGFLREGPPFSGPAYDRIKWIKLLQRLTARARVGTLCSVSSRIARRAGSNHTRHAHALLLSWLALFHPLAPVTLFALCWVVPRQAQSIRHAAAHSRMMTQAECNMH